MPLQLHPPPSDQTLCTGEAGLRRRQQRPCRAPRPTTVHVLLTVSTVTWAGHSPFVPRSILHSSCPEVDLYRLYHMGSLANRQLNRRRGGTRGERGCVCSLHSTLHSFIAWMQFCREISTLDHSCWGNLFSHSHTGFMPCYSLPLALKPEGDHLS